MKSAKPEALRYVEVADRIEKLIRSGAMRAGERVPSVRRSAVQHGASVATILQAYLRLEDRGLIEGRARSGFYVRAQLRELNRTPKPPRSSHAATVVDVGALQSRVFDAARMPDVVPFGAAYPGTELLPVARLGRITAAIARMDGGRSISYDMPPGTESLRRVIAARSLDWGCSLTPDDFITTCGGTEALSLCLRAAAKPGDVVAIESPTYFGVLQAIELLGLKAIEIPSNAETGMDLDELARVVRTRRIAACLAVPNFSNPLGSLMPDDHKQRLLEILTSRGVPLIEDDINGDLAHDGRRPRVTKSYDRDGSVMLCGSFSKTIAPGYRVGWVSPGKYFERVKQLKLASTLATASLPQLALAEFIANGGYDHHLRSLRQNFARQVARMREAILAEFPSGTEVTNPPGGFVLWVGLPPGISALELHSRAMAGKISIAPGPMFSARLGYPNFIRINCGNRWSPKTESAVGRLAEIVRRLQ